MKIGIDIRNIGKKRTGDEVVFLNLTKNFARIDQENEYKLFTDINNKETLQKIKKDLGIENKNNFEIITLTPALSQWARGISKFTWNFWTLPKYFRKKPVDIYLTQYITPFFVSKKIKIVTIIHDISFNFFPQFIKKTDLFFLKNLIPRSLKRADKILAVSRFTQNEIIKYYKIDPKKIDWFHNAVSEDFLKQDISEEKIKAVREKYKLPEKYILYIGTLQPRKNIPTLVEAFALLKLEVLMKNNPLKLVIAGGKGYNYDNSIDKVIEKNKLTKDVYFPGYIDEEDKAALMKGSEIFVFPSFYEGFGMPIIEAMMLGVPCIVSDIPAHQEIAHNSALFFNPRVPGELTQKIKEILSNDAERDGLSKNGEAQSKNFSWEKSAGRILEVFSKLIID